MYSSDTISSYINNNYVWRAVTSSCSNQECFEVVLLFILQIWKKISKFCYLVPYFDIINQGTAISLRGAPVPSFSFIGITRSVNPLAVKNKNILKLYNTSDYFKIRGIYTFYKKSCSVTATLYALKPMFGQYTRIIQ